MEIAPLPLIGGSAQEGGAPPIHEMGIQKFESMAQNIFYTFLSAYTGADERQDSLGSQPVSIYRAQLEQMRVEDSRTLKVEWQHLVNWNAENADSIQQAYYRVEPALRRAVKQLVKEVEPEFAQVWVCLLACACLCVCICLCECTAAGSGASPPGGEGGSGRTRPSDFECA